MSEILPISQRPRRLSDLVGQRTVISALRKQVASREPRAFLFYGPTGVGKTALAKIVAMTCQCPHQKTWGEPCDACWEREDEYLIHDINASEVNGVEEIGKVASMGRFRPTPPSKRRVIILDEAQMLTSNAQNLLLKHFERPPDHLVWIICTTAVNKLLPTLRRRCMMYQLRPLSYDEREQLLRTMAAKVGIKVKLETLVEAVNESQMSAPGLLLMALEQFASGMDAKTSVAGAEGGQLDSLRICKALTSGNWQELRKQLQEVTNDDARFLRASTSGWLCGCLKRDSSPARRKLLAQSIVELGSPAPMEEGLLMHWLWARLYQICVRMKEA